MPAAPPPPAAPAPPSKPEPPPAPAADTRPAAPAAPSAPGAPEAPKTEQVEGGQKKELSGKHWKEIADQKWPESQSLDDLDSDFKQKVQSFNKALEDNNIRVEIVSTLRPEQRAYLYHYCLAVSKEEVKPADVPTKEGVDIVWDHKDLDKSKAGAKEMAEAFGLTGIAAVKSKHTEGKAIDMKMDFTKNTKDGKNRLVYKPDGTEVTRELKVDDEARIGVSVKEKIIQSIKDRDLSKAGVDFGVRRALDNDIDHWSDTGT